MKNSARAVREKAHTYRQHWALLPFVAGVLIGLSLSTVFLLQPYADSPVTNVYIRLPGEEGEAARNSDLQRLLGELQPYRGGVEKLAQEVVMKDPVYYAVIMTDRHSSEQLEVLRHTWAGDVPSKRINFFIPAESAGETDPNTDHADVPVNDEDLHYGEINKDSIGAVVELPGTNLLEIRTLQYICQHKLNDTKWFFVSNDNIYVKSRLLEKFLQPYENLPHMGYLGKPVKREPIGRVCMPGPGTVLSYSVMAALCPRLDACAAAVRGSKSGSGTEYVIGECVQKQLGLQCNKDLGQPLEIFLRFEASKRGPIIAPRNHPALERAVTVYPVTDPKLMYHVHQFVVGGSLNESQHELHGLKVAVDRMSELLPRTDLRLNREAKPHDSVTSKDDIIAWKLLNHKLLMSGEEHGPALKATTPLNNEINLLMQKAMVNLNSWAAEEYVFKRIVNAYWKTNPLTGVDYIVDFEAKRADTDESDFSIVPKLFRVSLTRPFNPPEVSPVQPYPSDRYVNIAVFLTGSHLGSFQGFMKRLEEVLKHDQRVNLQVVQMRNPGEKRKNSNMMDPKSILSLYETKYPNAGFKIIDSPNQLSRAHGISLVIRESRPSELLFLADLDLEFDTGFIERCRNYPLQGQQAYFPIPFTKANPFILRDMNHTMMENAVSRHSGHWLVHSHSVACIYAADILVTTSHGLKGIPRDIEMTDVLKGLLDKGYEVIRPTDKGLKRGHALRNCDLDLHGESHDPCELVLDQPYESLYIKMQLSTLLSDHEGEHSETKF